MGLGLDPAAQMFLIVLLFIGVAFLLSADSLR